MERFGHRHHRIRSESPSQSETQTSSHSTKSRHIKAMSTPNAGRPVSTFSSASTLVAHTSESRKSRKDYESIDDTVPELRDLKLRPRTASSSSLNDMYHRRRRRSRSCRSETIVEPTDCKESSSDEDSSEACIKKRRPNSYMFRCGRRYLCDTDYMLPSDLQETQRQNLSTILTTTALGGPLCLPIDPLAPPQKVLDLGCGDGYWSTVCHDFFCCLKLPPPAFTGVDIAREGPDLSAFGLDWSFVNHDLSKIPLPFPDNSFDIVVCKDLAFSLKREHWIALMPELRRIVKPGGYMEYRDREYEFRKLLPPRRLDSGVTMQDEILARETGCYYIDGNTEFASCQNTFLQKASDWTAQLMVSSDHTSTPMRCLESSTQWHGWSKPEFRRVAVPLSRLVSWEQPSSAVSSPKERLGWPPVKLRSEQRALRFTALDVAIGLIEALEPFLRKSCSKNEEEWKRWWNAMMVSLIDDDDTDGECLEIGAVWARKEPAD